MGSLSRMASTFCDCALMYGATKYREPASSGWWRYGSVRTGGPARPCPPTAGQRHASAWQACVKMEMRVSCRTLPGSCCLFGQRRAGACAARIRCPGRCMFCVPPDAARCHCRAGRPAHSGTPTVPLQARLEKLMREHVRNMTIPLHPGGYHRCMLVLVVGILLHKTA